MNTLNSRCFTKPKFKSQTETDGINTLLHVSLTSRKQPSKQSVIIWFVWLSSLGKRPVLRHLDGSKLCKKDARHRKTAEACNIACKSLILSTITTSYMYLNNSESVFLFLSPEIVDFPRKRLKLSNVCKLSLVITTR